MTLGRADSLAISPTTGWSGRSERAAWGRCSSVSTGAMAAGVAVKLLHPMLAAAAEFRERFESEAHVAALLRSPYTVHLLDYGHEGDTYFLVMEYVEGQTLAEALREGPLPVEQALRIGISVARALEEAAARGVVHRDIKTENIMLLVEGGVKVADFGISRRAGVPGLTLTGAFLGTPDYAAPEQFEGQADERTDIYALGVTLFAMLAGRPPFEGTPLELMRQHRESTFPPEALAHVPEPAVEAVRRCMEKEPEARYQTATEVAAALGHALRRLSEEVQPPATSDAPAVSLSLREGRRSARTGATTYVLEVQNEGDGAVTVDLAAHLPAGEGIISLPDSVEVGGGGGTTITFEARPPKRRLRGSSRSTGFSVAATEPGGSPLSTATGEFDDTPVRWPIMAGGFLGGGALIAAVVGALLMATNVMSDDTPAPVSGNEEAVTGTPTSAQTPSATASDPGESATPQPRSGISRPRLEAPEPTEPLGFEILDGGADLHVPLDRCGGCGGLRHRVLGVLGGGPVTRLRERNPMRDRLGDSRAGCRGRRFVLDALRTAAPGVLADEVAGHGAFRRCGGAVRPPFARLGG